MDRVNWLPACLSALIAFGTLATPAKADAFVGTWGFDWYGDWNIQDGVSIIESQTTGTATRPDAQHVTLTDANMSITLLEDANMLRIESPPLDIGSGLCLAAYMMSDGIQSAFVHVGQEYSDPNDISVSVGLATRSTATVTPSDLAGDWQFDMISHVNLRDLADSPPEQFERNPASLHFTDIGGNQLQVDYIGYGPDGVFELVGNRVIPVSMDPSADQDHHLFGMVTDGNTLSLAVIRSELYDATDVSVSIGLGHQIPEPTTMALLTLGGLALIRRQRQVS